MENVRVIDKLVILKKLERILGKDDKLVTFMRKELEKAENCESDFSPEEFNKFYEKYTDEEKKKIETAILEWLFGKKK